MGSVTYIIEWLQKDSMQKIQQYNRQRMICKKTQIGCLINSETKSMNKMSILPKRLILENKIEIQEMKYSKKKKNQEQAQKTELTRWRKKLVMWKIEIQK